MIQTLDRIHFTVESASRLDPLHSVHVYAQEPSSIYIYIYIYPPAPPCGGHSAVGYFCQSFVLMSYDMMSYDMMSYDMMTTGRGPKT